MTFSQVQGSRTRMVAAGTKSTRQAGSTAATSRAMQNAHSADYLLTPMSTPIAAIPANLANPFTATSWNETGGNSSASS
ncbi:hypothetical protein G9U53_26335 [Rhodococcus sp. D-46]|uniref:hypothetical protein n=1 Tax=Rhodococcus sp. D-46 TaxID=2716265 RepID=UPI0013F5E750|nr:hypothetical protein [Rhodococcus sp. D-46]